MVSLDLEVIEISKQENPLVRSDVTEVREVPSIERQIQREVLKVIFQYPDLSLIWIEQLAKESFTHEPYKEVFEKLKSKKLTRIYSLDWSLLVENESIKRNFSLAVEPFSFEVGQNYVDWYLLTIRITTLQQIEQLKSKLQREQEFLAPTEQADLLKELMNLEEYRRALRDHALGSPG